MKKRDKKLELHRDTLLRLDRELPREDMRKVAGGGWTSCIEPDCCGDVQQQRIAQ